MTDIKTRRAAALEAVKQWREIALIHPPLSRWLPIYDTFDDLLQPSPPVDLCGTISTNDKPPDQPKLSNRYAIHDGDNSFAVADPYKLSEQDHTALNKALRASVTVISEGVADSEAEIENMDKPLRGVDGSEAMREAFERELKFREPHAYVVRNGDAYSGVMTEFDWQMWQAAWKAAKHPQREEWRNATEAEIMPALMQHIGEERAVLILSAILTSGIKLVKRELPSPPKAKK